MKLLQRYDAAQKALAAAQRVDECARIRDEATALKAVAKVAKNRDMEIRAADIRFRATRRMGQLLAKAKAAGQVAEGRPGKDKKNGPENGPFSRVTLEQAGISKNLSSEAQRMAAITDAEWEALCANWREHAADTTARVRLDLLKLGSEERSRENRREVLRTLSDVSAELPTGRRVPVMYADPPWERKGGITNRSYENHYPTMSWPDIVKLMRSLRDRLLPDAWFFLWIPRAHLLALIEIETEVVLPDTGEVITAKVDMPLSWAIAHALGMDSYSTCFVWTKTDEDHPDESGSGIIAYDQDELLLLFKRGKGLPKPATTEKFGSNHRERSKPLGHSRKPEHYRRMIAAMTGGLPVLELFARVDDENPLPKGWLAWGNQAQGKTKHEATTTNRPHARKRAKHRPAKSKT